MFAVLLANDIFRALDLVRIFMVLSQQKNMRKASEKMFVSQPANQSIFALGEELFVKVRTGLEATPFAGDIYQQVFPHFDALQTIVDNSQEFIAARLNL